MVTTLNAASFGGNEDAGLELLFQAYKSGDADAMERFYLAIYGPLRRLARVKILLEGPRAPVDTTALVHEVVERLLRVSPERWRGLRPFLSYASSAMMHIVFDHARRRRNRVRTEPLDVLVDTLTERAGGKLDHVHEALDELKACLPMAHEVVVLRFFGGASVSETANILRIPRKAVARDEKFAQAFLRRRLRDFGAA